MITIPKELREAMRASQGQPIRLTDPHTNATYVVLPAEMFAQRQTWFYDTPLLTREEQRALLTRAGLRVGWDDPEMDVYNELDPRN